MPVWKREDSYIKVAGERGKEGIPKKESGRLKVRSRKKTIAAVSVALAASPAQ